ncbi:hypothetical protein ABE957_15280 [Halomonas sp. CS7]|uniref:Uncharacterized protein n=1 Tax=Halomonas pelophila TaxID=3151122 RepID=A0ABV1NC95_9GAMM
MSLVKNFFHEVKHLPGWHTGVKYVAFAVDDYGSIRTAKKRAVEALKDRVSGFGGYMDYCDSVETREDLHMLYGVLARHRDAQARRVVFTAYALSANPDTAFMLREGRYGYETLSTTFARLAAEEPAAYEGTCQAWQEGMEECLIRPQFHGREHFSVPLLERKLARGDKDLQANLEVASMAGLAGVPDMPGVAFTHAFSLHDEVLLAQHREIIREGLALFETTFGFASTTFTPPALKLHPALDDFVAGLGVRSIDKPLSGRQPSGGGKSRRSVNFLTPPKGGQAGKLVRTLSFEPCSGNKSDPVGQALREMAAAFRWRKPVIISSHRVNFAGHIDPANRQQGLEKLDELLAGMLRRWPDIHFVSVDELVQIMEKGEGE